MKIVNAEIITIGDEILYGQILDTNSQWISAELDKIGVKIIRKTSIGDTESEIESIFVEASSRADIIITTGGLGPTKDDITKKTIAKILNDDLVINEHALQFISQLFSSRGRELQEINKLQAAIPSKSTYLPNTLGTAPGMWFTYNSAIVISLPGVPHEMRGLITNEVIPRLKKHFQTPVIVHKIIRTIGIGESFLSEKIETWEDQLPPNIRLAYLPSFGQVKLRLTGIGDELSAVNEAIQEEIDKVMPLIHKFVFSLTNENLEEAIGRILKADNSTLSIAESCTGGYVSHLITSIPGSSAYLNGGVVSYSNEIKEQVLGVKPTTLESFGAVSKETVEEMAEGVRKLMNTTYGIATSGVAGPGGGTPEKPVGLVYIAVSTAEKTVSSKLQLTTERISNIQYTAYAVLNLLRLVINKEK